MKKTTYYASKGLVIDGTPVKQGEVLLTVETEIPVDRALRAIENGAATPTLPTPPKPAAEGDAAPATKAAKPAK